MTRKQINAIPKHKVYQIHGSKGRVEVIGWARFNNNSNDLMLVASTLDRQRQTFVVGIIGASGLEERFIIV